MKRHRTDLTSLLFGAIFVVIASLWLVSHFVPVRVTTPHLGWVLAGSLIGLGLLGVVASLRRGAEPAVPAGSGPSGGAGPDPESPSGEAHRSI